MQGASRIARFCASLGRCAIDQIMLSWSGIGLCLAAAELEKKQSVGEDAPDADDRQ